MINNKNNILIINILVFFVKYIFTILFLFIFSYSFSQQDSLLQNDTIKNIIVKDTLSIKNLTSENISDSIKTDSIKTDSIKNDAISPDAIDQVIDYSCNDSILFSFIAEKMYLYGNGDITAKDMDLKSSYVEISTEGSYLYSKTVADSSGKNKIKPILTQDDENFSVSSIKYNFRTKRALVKDVKTEMEQGFLHSKVAKMQTNKEFHIKNGKFTTCDLDHPHFYIELTKAKKIPDKHVISGPMYFVIADIPLYIIGLPFGILPNQKHNSSGLIIPEYGEDQQRGFFLRNGGYFWAINDYINAAVLGDIYSRGSWGVTVKSNFKKLYKYSGSLEMKYNLIKTGEEILIDSKKTSSFSIVGSFQQDAKANPNGTFSASVNFGQNFELDARNINDLTDNTKSSNISYRWSKPGSIFNFSTNIRGTQNTKNHSINILLPDLSFNIKRQMPFKNVGAGTNKWYQKIGYTFTLKAKNSLTTGDSALFQKDVLYKFKNGLQYSVPVSTSFTLLNYINVSPSLNFTGRMYSNYIKQNNVLLIDENEIVQAIKKDTIYRVTFPFDFNFSFPMSTKIYGIFNINKGRVQALRHVMSPSLSFNYRPDFSRDFWGYYGYNDLDSSYYSYYEDNIYKGPLSGKSGSINFSLGNNLEMKLKNKNDTVSESKKIKLLNSLNMGISYNLAADSINLSNLSIRGNTKLLKNFNLTFGADFDPYVRDSAGTKINTFEWTKNHRLARFNTGRISLSGSLKPSKSKTTEKDVHSDFYYYQHPEIPYADFDIPWNLTANYNLNIVNKFDVPSQLYVRNLTQTVSLSGNFSLTPNWKITAKTNYDVAARKFSYAQFTVYRDLHCWEMSFNVIPFGTLRSYSFRINIKSNVFKGVEYNKRKEWDKSKLY